MKAEKIYLDMDGVLADFDRGVRELCGMDPLPQTGKTDPHQDDLMWEAIRKVESLFPDAVSWRLDTIAQEKKLCHLYQKMGYRKTGETEHIKDGMDTIFFEKSRVTTL